MACNCSLTLQNTGVPGCKTIFSVSKKLILVPLYGDDGSENKIDLINDVLDASYFTGKVNETDGSKRWYPLPLIDNVEDVKADPVTQSTNAGRNIIVEDGARTFSGVLLKQSNVLIGKINSFKCKKFGVYIIDKDGNLIGNVDGDFLAPIPVDEDTLNVALGKTTDTTVQEIQISFEFSLTAKDEDLSMIAASEMAGASLLLLNGLLDINQVISNPAVGGFTSTNTLDYGTALNKINVKGLALADFAVYNNTTPGAVVITSVTESADGVYDIVIPAQTALDSLTVTISKVGFEDSAVTFAV